MSSEHAPEPHQLYRYADLVKLNIVNSRAQLAKMIARDGFPSGFILSPQIRAYRASDVERWLASRPTAQIKTRGRAKALVEKAAEKQQEVA